jgi:hypothetical protein
MYTYSSIRENSLQNTDHKLYVLSNKTDFRRLINMTSKQKLL